ncbi:GNAT family N-acetyltransferase [Cohnella faecalis]|nr:GNAT family N-acetyltransferase [Cohnella faecalis]
MDAKLIGYQMPAGIKELRRSKEAEGYFFGALSPDDLVAVIRFAGTVFYPDWARALREAVYRGVPLSRIRVARGPDSRIVGFCMYGGYSDIQERFGPFGVDPNAQGTGIGKILFHDCLTAMREEGLHGAFFLWTDEQSSAGHLYKNAGFEVSRRFHVMKKRLG